LGNFCDNFQMRHTKTLCAQFISVLPLTLQFEGLHDSLLELTCLGLADYATTPKHQLQRVSLSPAPQLFPPPRSEHSPSFLPPLSPPPSSNASIRATCLPGANACEFLVPRRHPLTYDTPWRRESVREWRATTCRVRMPYHHGSAIQGDDVNVQRVRA